MLNDAERWPEAKATCEAELDGRRAARPADARDGQLGPFELFEPFAVAGIGEIWSARRGDGALDPRLAIERGLAGPGRPAVFARLLRQRPRLARREACPRCTDPEHYGSTRDGPDEL